MHPVKAIAAVAAAATIFAASASAALTGYIKIPDIDGEAQRASGGEHEVEYDIVAGQAAAPVGGNETLSVGANRTETIKGGQAVVVGALWNGKDAPPAKGRAGTVNVTLKRGVLSQSLARLKAEKRAIPSLTLVLGEGRGEMKYELENVLITSYSVSGASASGEVHEEVAFYYNKISF